MSAKERNPYDPPKRRIRFGRILFYIISTALIVLLVTILFNVIITRKSGNPPSVFGYSVFIVTTNSMEPEMPPGAAILVHAVDPDTLAEGDVITFKEGYDPDGKLIVNTHRIVNIEQSGDTRVFTTKGDNNNVADEKLRTEDVILGKALLTMPTVGKFFAFIKQPIGLVTCIAVPLLILLIFEIINLVRLSRKPKGGDLPFSDDEPAVESKFDTLDVKTRKKRALFDDDEPLPQELEELEEPEMPPVLTSQNPPRVPVPNVSNPPARPSWQPQRPPIQPPRADVRGVGVGVAVGAATGAARGEANPYNLNIHAEPDNTPLESVTETIDGLSYIKPVPSGENAIYATQEFSLRSASPAGIQTTWAQLDENTPPPVPSARPVSREGETLYSAGKSGQNFSANMASKGRDQFQIDGIDVKVKPDALNLAFGEDAHGRDISITVTKDYTNVTVGSNENEVNFALFRDESDDGQKVIIQKKNK